jgi:hypothetical protein
MLASGNNSRARMVMKPVRRKKKTTPKLEWLRESITRQWLQLLLILFGLYNAIFKINNGTRLVRRLRLQHNDLAPYGSRTSTLFILEFFACVALSALINMAETRKHDREEVEGGGVATSLDRLPPGES